MASIDVDTVLRGLNSKNKVEDYAKEQQGFFQQLAAAGVSGPSMDAYASALKELQGLNGALRTEGSAARYGAEPGRDPRPRRRREVGRHPRDQGLPGRDGQRLGLDRPEER